MSTGIIGKTPTRPTSGNEHEVSKVQKECKNQLPGYAGFIAGIFSGVAKLAVGHPFDTIKVRLQTAEAGRFNGAFDCVRKTISNEGFRALYKGASPPLVGWMVMDSVMLGSLHNYRRCVKDYMYPHESKLTLTGHCIAGMLAGWTVSFVAAPIENIKARLQIQYDAKTKLYTGPIDCAAKLVQQNGIAGLYKGLFSTMIFRSNFVFWWGSYEVFTQAFKKHTQLSNPAINFWAGGLSASVFWITAYPSDVVKQYIMTDSVTSPKYQSWWSACKAVYQTKGWGGYWRGFTPSFIRSFPANAAALAAFEAVLRTFH
ncbi:mitochondrial carrier [Nadsonia fulvescens var. elongata DSM 6958]|uniref:Mitochondrial carrier n=1 Tax=Nadsonia fulvescens var. elongata DSM 6958 TaxID=857566 RepID=A0A1E3PMD3_9ASCO|nr:mitochondrial carrier [Nadsonia fulvescens var. elongata DSM 6958]